MITRSGHIPGYPPAGLGIAKRKPVFPQDGASFTAHTGRTLDSLYLFNEASGNVLDKIGSANLTAGGTPTFSVDREGRRGIHYDANIDRHSADVHAVGTTSFLAFGVFGVQAGHADFAGLMGRINAGADPGWIVYHRSSGAVEFIVRDDGAGLVNQATAAASLATALTFVGFQCDRTAAVVRVRASRPGAAALTTSASIAAFSTFNGAGLQFGFGPALGGSNVLGALVCYGGIRVNADTEGASVLSDLAKSLGWEK